MMDQNREKKQKRMKKRFYGLLAILLSFLFHFGVLYELGQKDYNTQPKKNALPQGYIKLDVPNKKDKKKNIDEDEKEKRILETPLAPTQAPSEAEFLGQNDHQAKKLMKVKNHLQAKALDPGLAQVHEKKSMQVSPRNEIPKEKDVKTEKLQKVKDIGRNLYKENNEHKRNPYEDLLANSTEQLAESQIKQGYMDHLNDLVEEGETIDMNTREYRYIGYFTSLRKAIELVWNYPSEAARRGLHGAVLLKFIILENGRVSKVQVMESSGHNILDDAIVNAIHAASPFAPLPKGFKKEHLVIRGAFHYVLGNY